MEKRIVFTNLDGSLGIVQPTLEALKSLTIEEIAAKDVPNGLEWHIIDFNKIPTDRTFRNAWKDSVIKIDVDMKKAREIHMKKIRELRNAKLAKLDIETLKGIDVQKEKQILRDLPKNIDLDLITAPDELKKFIPKELK